MNREEALKSLIKDKYGSVLRFSRETGIPESSIRNIFSRGMDSVSAGTLVDICRALGADVESLMGGRVAIRAREPHQVTDEEIKFALFGGGGEITDDMYDEVKRFARFVMLRQEQKGQE